MTVAKVANVRNLLKAETSEVQAAKAPPPLLRDGRNKTSILSLISSLHRKTQ